MKFASTRGEAPQVGFSQALLQGLAPDGGLYVPTQWPAVAAGIEAGESLPAVGQHLIGAFAAGDALEASLPDIVNEAFDFPAPLVALADVPAASMLGRAWDTVRLWFK